MDGDGSLNRGNANSLLCELFNLSNEDAQALVQVFGSVEGAIEAYCNNPRVITDLGLSENADTNDGNDQATHAAQDSDSDEIYGAARRSSKRNAGNLQPASSSSNSSNASAKGWPIVAKAGPEARQAGQNAKVAETTEHSSSSNAISSNKAVAGMTQTSSLRRLTVCETQREANTNKRRSDLQWLNGAKQLELEARCKCGSNVVRIGTGTQLNMEQFRTEPRVHAPLEVCHCRGCRKRGAAGYAVLLRTCSESPARKASSIQTSLIGTQHECSESAARKASSHECGESAAQASRNASSI